MESNFGSESRENIEHRDFNKRSSGAILKDIITAIENSNSPVEESSHKSNDDIFGKEKEITPMQYVAYIWSQDSNSRYNSLEDIDKLIDNLVSAKTPDFQTQEGKEVLSLRQQKIEELKKLSKEIREQEKERKAIEEMRQENEMLDRLIASIRKKDNNGKHF